MKTKKHGDIKAEDDIFIRYAMGVVVDKRNGLMWAQADNGCKLTIEEAKAYAAAFGLADLRTGGFRISRSSKA